MRYDDFELLVTKDGADQYSTRVISASAGEAKGTLAFNSTYDDIQRALARIKAEETDEELFVNLGRTLFQHLFSDEIESIYRASLGHARAQGKGLRIRLRIEPPELSAIPWEYLYDELNDLFLGVSPETPVTRYIQVAEPPRSITIHPILKVLVVISNPVNLAEYGLRELNAEKEKQVLSQALEEWQEEGLVELEFLDHAIASEIREKLRRYQPHIFHFIGHGAFRDDTGYLVIEDDDRRCRLINDRTFRKFFLGSDFTKLVVLNACQSATTSSTQPMVGLAHNLVRRGLPAVVAMQYSIYDDTAIKFSREFYRALALGFPVDTAISEARRGIYIDCGAERRDWGIPVLFMRSPDGVILKLPKPISRPLRLESIPRSGKFIGRKRELDECQAKLDSQNILVIGGTAGVGKTMLGAQIAIQHPQRRVFWHTFHRSLNDNLESVIWALGGFLTTGGDDTLQRFLDLNIEQLKEEGYQLSEALNLLIYSLEQGLYLLCFDDFQVADEDEKINSLFEIFNDRLQNTKVIVMSRQAPRFADALGLDYEPLTGLNEEDAKALLNRDGIHLNPELFAKLYAQTLGNPKLLELFITWMQNREWKSDEISEFIDRTLGERVEEHLIRNVYEALSAEEQKLLKAISIFRAPVDKEAIGEILIEEDMENIDDLLDALVHKYVVQESDYGEKFLHSLLVEFCYDRLRADAPFRTRLHRNAGRYYHGQEDYLEAAHHYFEAREYQKSAEVIIDNSEQLIYAGQSSAIMGQLGKLDSELLDAETWASVCIAMGDACMIAGEYDDAVESYQAILEIEPRLLGPRKAADVRRKIGEGYDRKGQYDQALKHYNEGIQILGENVSVELARIYGRLSRIYAHQGEYEKAIESARQGLKIVKGTGYEKEISDCYDAIGLVYLRKGDYDKAIQHYRKALKARERIGDKLGLARSYIQLGIACKFKGQYDKALKYYTDSLTTSEEIGDLMRIAVSHGELGFIQDIKSTYDEAIWHYNKGLTLFNRLGNKPLAAITHNNLGEAYRGKGEYDKAIEHLKMALKMYTDFEDKEGLSDVYRILSEINLRQGDIHQAQEYAQEALQLAAEIDSKPYKGCAYRALGKIQAATKNTDEARRYLDLSLDMFRQLGDKAEIAYTLNDIANFEYDAGDTKTAREVCTEALKTAEALGISKIIEQMTELKQKLA
ncbi:MAG: tetratricopeptide repeat protein [Anaerolineae bacterium]